jgi:hypothetical protein
MRAGPLRVSVGDLPGQRVVRGSRGRSRMGHDPAVAGQEREPDPRGAARTRRHSASASITQSGREPGTHAVRKRQGSAKKRRTSMGWCSRAPGAIASTSSSNSVDVPDNRERRRPCRQRSLSRRLPWSSGTGGGTDAFVVDPAMGDDVHRDQNTPRSSSSPRSSRRARPAHPCTATVDSSGISGREGSPHPAASLAGRPRRT